MSYSDTIQYLYNLQQYGIKFGLDNIRRLTHAFNQPHTAYSSIHVGGTNGKGTTSALIASMLQHAGFSVGLFTSPHLVSFTERIKVDGKEITEREVMELTEEIRDIVLHSKEDFSPTFFEVIVMMAFLYFERKRADVAVFEVGMGGRFDATNIITPLVSVITSIDYDHKDFLGETLPEIAREKAGIIKSGVPVVSSPQKREPMEVIKQKVRELNTKLYTFGEDFWSLLKHETTSEIYFDYCENEFEVRDIRLPLAGEYQMHNASVAIKAAAIALERLQFGVVQDHEDRFVSVIQDGLAGIHWPGRLEMIYEDPPIVIDGAHNPAAANALSRALQRNYSEKYKQLIIVIGIMGDKDARGIIEPLLPLASEVILTAPQYSRAAQPETLARIAQSLGSLHVRIARTVKEAVSMACELARNNGSSSLVVITGSFYTIGEAKEVIGAPGILSRLRE